MHQTGKHIKNSSSDVYTEKELSRRWKIDPKTLRNWRCQRRGPRYYKIGGTSVRYPAEEIVKAEAESLQGGSL